MGKIDILTKDYISDNNIFADAFNYFIYDGESVVNPDHLTDLDTTVLTAPYGVNGEALPVQKYRDKIKSWMLKRDDSAAYLLLAIENQTELHQAMPVRNMVYDALQYAEQVDKTAKKHRDAHDKAMSASEYLSGFYATDYLIPVITLVIYFNSDQWTAPKTLHEMFRVENKKILDFLPDYKINLIAPASMTKEEIDQMKSGLREVLLFIKYSKDKEKLRELVQTDTCFSHMDRKAVQVLQAVTNLKMEMTETEGEINMCIAIDEMCEDARNEGIQIGTEKGIQKGVLMRNHEIAEKMLQKQLSDALIIEVSGISEADLQQIKLHIKA